MVATFGNDDVEFFRSGNPNRSTSPGLGRVAVDKPDQGDLRMRQENRSGPVVAVVFKGYGDTHVCKANAWR